MAPLGWIVIPDNENQWKLGTMPKLYFLLWKFFLNFNTTIINILPFLHPVQHVNVFLTFMIDVNAIYRPPHRQQQPFHFPYRATFENANNPSIIPRRERKILVSKRHSIEKFVMSKGHRWMVPSTSIELESIIASAGESALAGCSTRGERRWIWRPIVTKGVCAIN